MFCSSKRALAGALSVVCASTLALCAASAQSADATSSPNPAAASPQAVKSPSGSHLLVTVTSPTINQQVPGKVIIKATAQNTPLTNGGVAFWAIYESGNLVWFDVNPTTSINIPIAVTPGAHNFKIEAYDDSYTPSSASVPVNATSSGSEMTWHACMYTYQGQRMQAMKFFPKATMTGVLQSQLFTNAGCNPTQWNDQLNDYGTPMTVSSGSGYIYFFIHRPNISGVSAVWTFGNQTSGCVNYSTAPAC